jgi:2-polyprenyl-6-hydroxyphenyl methylase/3-demethylubiquinone-9 3-methyltransferase
VLLLLPLASVVVVELVVPGCCCCMEPLAFCCCILPFAFWVAPVFGIAVVVVVVEVCGVVESGVMAASSANAALAINAVANTLSAKIFFIFKSLYKVEKLKNYIQLTQFGIINGYHAPRQAARLAQLSDGSFMNKTNVDQSEIAKFSEHAAHWWDPEGDFKPLHLINPIRLNYIHGKVNLAGKKVIDIGCGGGILTESMALLHADVTGIDMSSAAIKIAKLRQLETNTNITYQVTTAEAMAMEHANQYDVVTCLEMLEHVPDPVSVVQACAALVKPGGSVFFSTLNRNTKAYLQAIIAAEYLLKLLPRHTHDYAKFIKPSELAKWAQAVDLSVLDMTGITYNPLTKHYKLTDNVDVNYLMYLQK